MQSNKSIQVTIVVHKGVDIFSENTLRYNNYL